MTHSTIPLHALPSAKVSSAVIFDQVQLLRDLHGSEVVVRAHSSLPKELGEELATLAPGSWISLDAARELKNAVAGIVGVDALDLQRLLSARGVERTLTTFWRFFLRQLGDEALSKRTPLLYARTFNCGSLTLASWREGCVDFELRGWEIPMYDLVGLMAGVQRVLELAGRVNVHMTMARRSPVLVILHASWTRKH